ncbi:FAD-binding domain-containing protein 11 [Elsinoe fawcettii]|nr:FAD-binding domain-containing protein 11 [Elsinoe fawcettii]
MKVGIVGAGLAGLMTAIALRQKDIHVVVLEQSDDFKETGAGIVISPSIRRIMLRLGFNDDAIASVLEMQQRYILKDGFSGEVILGRPGPAWAEKHFGDCWYHCHREDLHCLLLGKALGLGVHVRSSCRVVRIGSSMDSTTTIVLSSGDIIEADVIIGADGIGSQVRAFVAGEDVDPCGTGDMGYRVLLSRSAVELRAAGEPAHVLQPILDMPSEAWAWLGPDRHVMLYPLRKGTLYNLVVLCPDTLSAGTHRSTDSVEELRSQIKGWDPALQALVGSIESPNVSVLKIQYLRPEQLPMLHRDNVVLVGDAGHATLPYQGAGFSLAAEGAILLTELLSKYQAGKGSRGLSHILAEYSNKHIERIQLQYEGAISNRKLFHLSDKDTCTKRAEVLPHIAWNVSKESLAQPSSPWTFGDMSYYKAQFGYDPYQHAAHDQA